LALHHALLERGIAMIRYASANLHFSDDEKKILKRPPYVRRYTTAECIAFPSIHSGAELKMFCTVNRETKINKLRRAETRCRKVRFPAELFPSKAAVRYVR
jgi:hypothetical protein